MPDGVTTAIVVVIALVVAVFAWLVLISRGGRPIKLNIKALGVEVNVDAPGFSTQGNQNGSNP